MIVWGVTGWKNAGKTTLVEKLVRELRARGLRVATVKHAHHGFDIDHEGKDSWRHRQAGASQVIVASDVRVAQVTELAEELPLSALIARLGPCDVVLVEGWKREGHPKIEVHRADRGGDLICEGDETVRVLVTDASLDIGLPVFGLEDAGGIVDYMLKDQ